MLSLGLSPGVTAGSVHEKNKHGSCFRGADNNRPQQFKQKGLLSNRAWAPFVQSLCGARFPRFKDLM